MSRDLQSLVRSILEENQYMTIASVGSDGAWAAPVQFCVDRNLNLYFVSMPTSRHAQHIAESPAVGIAIFDSTQPPLTGRGIQVEGMAAFFSDTENPFATIGDLDMPRELQKVAPGYAAYMVSPRRFYVPRSYLDGELRDERVEIHMG